MENDNITVLVVEPEKKPYVKSIASGLASLQHEVGGYIQAVYPREDDPCSIICDEEGKLKSNQYNRVLRDEDGDIYDVIAGTFLVVGLGKETFDSLEAKYIQKYGELFAKPELFIRTGDRLIVIAAEEADDEF